MEGTGLDNATRLYRIRRTCNEMLADRGYVIGTVSNITEGQCAAFCCCTPCAAVAPADTHCRCFRGVVCQCQDSGG